MTPRLKERLRQVGVDLAHKLMPAYPLDTWVKSISEAAQELYPEKPESESWRLLGERMVDGYQGTVVGAAMFALMKVIGPRRTLVKVQKNFRYGNNYTEARLRDVSPKVVEVWMNDSGPVRYFSQGMIHAALRASGASGLAVDILHSDDQGTTFRVTWGD
jgi:uncharacterized protein (TIGR02265 family)